VKDVKKSRQPPEVARYIEDTKDSAKSIKNTSFCERRQFKTSVKERISKSPVRWRRGWKPVLS
jgi:hypothetical protein